LFLELDLQKFAEKTNPEIYSLNFEFIPSPELAIIKSQSTIDDSLRLRGNKTILHLTQENISSRSAFENNLVEINNPRTNGF